jgi:hypothetical protein
LAFARLGELNVFDEVVENLLFVASKTCIIGLVPVEVENARSNAMGDLVCLGVLSVVVGLVLAPIGSKNILELPLELGERVCGSWNEVPRGKWVGFGKGRWSDHGRGKERIVGEAQSRECACQ